MYKRLPPSKLHGNFKRPDPAKLDAYVKEWEAIQELNPARRLSPARRTIFELEPQMRTEIWREGENGWDPNQKNAVFLDGYMRVALGFWAGLPGSRQITWNAVFQWIDLLCSTSGKQVYVYKFNSQGVAEDPIPHSSHVVLPGTYVLLGSPPGRDVIEVTHNVFRHANYEDFTSVEIDDLIKRQVQTRDTHCLLTGQKKNLEVIPIIPSNAEMLWKEIEVNDISKSEANAFCICRRLVDGWYQYHFFIDIENENMIVPVVPGYDDLVGKSFDKSYIPDGVWKKMEIALQAHKKQTLFQRVATGGIRRGFGA